MNRKKAPNPGGERPERLRKLNEQIRILIRWLPRDADHPFGFVCECGCGERMKLTADEYDTLGSNPVYAAGHSRAIA